MGPIDFHSIFSLLLKSMGSMNFLVTNFFCLQQKKEIDIGLEQLEGE